MKDIGRMFNLLVDQPEMDKERTVLRVRIDGGSGSLKIWGIFSMLMKTLKFVHIV